MSDAAINFASQTRVDAATSRIRNASGSTLDAKTLRRIDASAKEFEASFLSEMIKPMFEGIKVDEMFGGGRGEEVFQDMMVQEYGKKMADSGGVGIAAFVRNELIKQQEGKVKQ
jgi:Rod binding domain-containing protein